MRSGASRIYRVTRDLRATFRPYAPVVIGGITFGPAGKRDDPWLLASCDIPAVNHVTATNEFNRLLLLALDAIAVVMGAGASPRGASTLVEKRRSKYVLLQAIKRRPSAPLTVHPGYHDPLIGEADQLARTFPKLERTAANYLRQTVATESLIDMAFHLLQATEALAPKSRTKTDYAKVKKIMGERPTASSTNEIRYSKTRDATPSRMDE